MSRGPNYDDSLIRDFFGLRPKSERTLRDDFAMAAPPYPFKPIQIDPDSNKPAEA